MQAKGVLVAQNTVFIKGFCPYKFYSGGFYSFRSED